MEDVYYNTSYPGSFEAYKGWKKNIIKNGNGTLFITRTPYTNRFENRSLEDAF